MIRPLLALIALTVATPAFAHDEPIGDWSGPYISITAGGESKQARTSGEVDSVNQISGLFVPTRGIVIVPSTSTPIAASGSETGLIAGGNLGWNFQSRHIVYGIEVDASYSKSSPDAATTVTLPVTTLSPAATLAASRTVQNKFDASVRLKLGYATGKVLIYLTGGIVGTRADATAVDLFSVPAGPAAPCAPTPCTTANFGPYGPTTTIHTYETKTMIGWTAGGGIAYKLSKKFSIGLDYSYRDYGAKTFLPVSSVRMGTGVTITDSMGNHPTGIAGGLPGVPRITLRSNRVAARLSFHF